MGLLGGLALFLYGMDLMAAALKLIAGEGLRGVLAKLTTNRFTGVAAGAFVTAIIQSSSVTTVLVVGFISAGLMSLSQSVGVIMGANIGTTITAQIIAFKVTKYALALIAIGFLLQFQSKRERLKQYGNLFLGLGLIFFGMHLMGDGTRPLQSYTPFIDMMKGMDSPWLGVLFGALFTGLVQSSSATTGIVIVLAGQGFLSLPAGIALVFGANIGTCVTAGLAAIGKSAEARRAVLVHVLFNLLGVALWFGFIPYLSLWVTEFSPKTPQLEGAARLAAETPRQIANAHTLFNIGNTLVFIWFVGPLARFVTWLIPDRAGQELESGAPKFLEPLLLGTPSLALETVRREIGRLGAIIVRMTRSSMAAVVEGDAEDLEKLVRQDEAVEQLHAAITGYLGELSKRELTEHQAGQVNDFLATTNYLANIGDLVEINLVGAGRARLLRNLRISDVTRAQLEIFHKEVTASVARAVHAIVENDQVAAEEVLEAKSRIAALAEEAEVHLSRRLTADAPQRQNLFRLESAVIEHLKRAFYLAKRIAKLVAEASAREEESGADHSEPK
jgi:phosphate:Na+ symporter